MREGRRAHPRLERRLVAPPGDDEPGRPVVGGLEQLEALEAVLVVDGAGPGGEPVGELVAARGVDGDGVDLDDAHATSVPDGVPAPVRAAAGSAGDRRRDREDQAGRRRVRQQAAAGVGEPGLGQRRPGAAREDGADGGDLAGLDRDRAQVLRDEVDRGVALAGRQHAVDGAAGRAVEQHRDDAAVHAAERVVVELLRHQPERRRPDLGAEPGEAERVHDRRRAAARRPPSSSAGRCPVRCRARRRSATGPASGRCARGARRRPRPILGLGLSHGPSMAAAC